MSVVPLQSPPEAGSGAAPPPPRPTLVQRLSVTPATGYALIALAAVAGITVLFAGAEPGLAGLVLLIALTLTAAGLIYAAAQPAQSGLGRRDKLKSLILDQFAEAVAVTDKTGLLVFANEAYLGAFRGPDGIVQAPDSVLGGVNETAARLFRLMRAAAEGGSVQVPMTPGPRVCAAPFGAEFTVSVSPLKGARGLALWRIAPRPPDEPPPPANVIALHAPGAIATLAGEPAPPAAARDGSAMTEASEIGPAPALAAFDSAPLGLALVSATGALLEANATFARLSSGGAVAPGAAIAGAFHPSDEKALRGLLEEAGEGGAAGPLEMRWAAAPQGSVQAVAAPFPPAADGTRRVILYLTDTTEQKSIELQFAQSLKMQAVGQLAGGVAHDFNNLLTVILGFTELLLQRHTPRDPSFADLMQIKNNATRAARLVAQLLAFSRRQVLQSKVFHVEELLNDFSDFLCRALTERVLLQTQFGREVWPVRVDDAQFSNMIMNLALNAKDAMPEGGTLTLRTSNVTLPERVRTDLVEVPAGDYVLIEVADTGTGIPTDILGQIFEPFFTTKGQGKGTGLGLSMAYGFVKQSGGFIFPESEVGKGTTFRIYLPRYVGPEGTAAVSDDAERAPARDLTGRETILLVEDEDAVRNFAARALSMRGYTIMEADGAEAALEIGRQHLERIALLITDVVMPNMDGPTLAKELRKLKPDLKVIFISGYAEDAFRRAHENPEAIHFIPKPFLLKQLAAKVKDVIDGG